MMKKTARILCFILALLILMLSVASCEKKPGLYTWYGVKMDVDNILKLTVDNGSGEKVYNVPFDLYRNLFVYYKKIVSDVVVDENEVKKITTDEQKTAALREQTEDEIKKYYTYVAIAEKYGVGLTENDEKLYDSNYEARIENYADKLEDKASDFKGTKEEYAEYLYNRAIENLGMTPEYFRYLYFRDLLLKRIKKAMFPELKTYAEESFTRFKQIYIEYTKGDEADENSARDKINEAYARLKNGEDIDDLISEYNNSVYESDIIFDSFDAIVASNTNNNVGTVTSETVKGLNAGEYTSVMSGDSDDQTAYFAIFMRVGFDEDFIYGTSEKSQDIFMYSYVGAESYSVYYTMYNDYINAYEQNTRVEPFDANVYKYVKINSMY